MARLRIHFKKNSDGASSMSCVRADGSVTWQRQPKPAHARFFLLHDLTHYAVETVLNFRRGFYGLISEGWNFADFGAPWPRGPIPSDAEPAELIVGFFDSQRAAGEQWTAAEFNSRLQAFFSSAGKAAPLELTEEQLASIRQHIVDLVERWESVPAGQALNLEFGLHAEQERPGKGLPASALDG